MFNCIRGAAAYGVQGRIIDVEIDMSEGLPSFDMVGLLSSEVREARERIKSALKNMGIFLPPKRITVNLSPASLRKEGTGYDLPIAIGILQAINMIQKESTEEYMICGEIGLDGTVKAINGILPMVDAACKAGLKRAIVPMDNVNEAKIIKEIEVIGISNISQIIELLNYGIIPDNPSEIQEEDDDEILDFSDVVGQDTAVRAALIAACGMHHFLMLGAPGAAKSMIASRIPFILPESTRDEMIEVTKIYSISGKLEKDELVKRRPFRAPHHTATTISLIGGGREPRCGEVSFAHQGVLFLDELTEFKKDTIDALRQPLEEGRVVINRLNGSYVFPARFMLIGAANRCKCGHYP